MGLSNPAGESFSPLIEGYKARQFQVVSLINYLCLDIVT